MKNIISTGYGSDYIVRAAETGKTLTEVIVFEPMHDKPALQAVQVYCEAMNPSEEKTELQAYIERVKKHWKDCAND